MPGIITITFSPCIDKSASVHSLLPEKKLKCSMPKLEPGGGGINVARAIQKLGGKATAIFPSGGYTGKFFNKLIQDEGVPSIIIETENETRENFIILEESSNLQYRFGMPGTGLKETEWQQLLKAVEEAKGVEFIVASGSLPSGMPTDIFARLAVITKRKKAKLIVDTSGEPLKQAIREEIYLIKPSIRELSSLVDKEYLQPNEIAEAAKQVIEKGRCTIIIVSLGSAGAMLVTKDLIQTITPPPVKIKSTVGAGDSMVAGIVLLLSKGSSLEKAVQYGVACGTAATMNAGTELCKSEDAETLYMLINNSGASPAIVNIKSGYSV